MFIKNVDRAGKIFLYLMKLSKVVSSKKKNVVQFQENKDNMLAIEDQKTFKCFGYPSNYMRLLYYLN